ncbi:hypothetical protein [Flammeovirga kamogawensis]|uniref:Outer membrane beta-barrel protein n=1 Tax=Flammeovirga kamogawensis TaxID=373891 RepID=A0ABX8H2H0_9BACT|nr:hypothetical protein [Flammeovirga kamogawensis]MBB6463955.1 hypothetical protein [Flammeovirga kamogawensis]QWG09767.1 hypothetical protein KM029_18990 [Flammeovirga kamogawensis]TRX65277.1 hypothetical protein EO216_22400 [Flammeovirga kamogawensis]
MKKLAVLLCSLCCTSFIYAQNKPIGYLSFTGAGSAVLQRQAVSSVFTIDYNHYIADHWMIGGSLINDWEKQTGTRTEYGSGNSYKATLAIYTTYVTGNWGFGGGYARDIAKEGQLTKKGNNYLDVFVMYFIKVGNHYICPRVGYIHDLHDQEQSLSLGVSYSIPF